VARPIRFLLFAAAAGLTASCAFVLAFFGGREVFRAAPTAPWLALLLLASAPLLGRIGRWALGPRGPVAAAIAIALVAPMIVLGAFHELSEPLIYAQPPMCGTPRMTLEMSVPPAMFVAGATSALLAALLVAYGGPRLDRALHALVAALAAITAVLVGGSILRAARYPDTDHYVRALPIVAEVPAASGLLQILAADPLVRRTAPDRAADIPRSSVFLYDADLGGALLRRTCAAHRCRATFVPRGTPKNQVRYDWWEVEETAIITARGAPTHALWVVEAEGARAYLGPDFERSDVRVRDVASSVSPPIGWILGAAGGLALAGAALALRRRAAHRRAAIAEGRAGTLEPSGLVKVTGDDHPLRVAPGQTLVVGPVVVLPGPVAPGGVYRGDGLLLGARVACGEQDELLDAASTKMAYLDTLALAALALTAAPLVASAIVGIVI
jgi:hypothetical protein